MAAKVEPITEAEEAEAKSKANIHNQREAPIEEEKMERGLSEHNADGFNGSDPTATEHLDKSPHGIQPRIDALEAGVLENRNSDPTQAGPASSRSRGDHSIRGTSRRASQPEGHYRRGSVVLDQMEAELIL